jgi:hypothetical protein
MHIGHYHISLRKRPPQVRGSIVYIYLLKKYTRQDHMGRNVLHWKYPNNVTTPGDENVLRSHPAGAQPSMGYPQNVTGGLIIISMPVQYHHPRRTRGKTRTLCASFF